MVCNSEKCNAECCRKFYMLMGDLSEDLVDYFIYHENIKVLELDDGIVLEISSKCKHLNSENKCLIYDRRPEFCRNYPKNAKITEKDCTAIND